MSLWKHRPRQRPTSRRDENFASEIKVRLDLEMADAGQQGLSVGLRYA
jgi:hypothetical protein